MDTDRKCERIPTGPCDPILWGQMGLISSKFSSNAFLTFDLTLVHLSELARRMKPHTSA